MVKLFAPSTIGAISLATINTAAATATPSTHFQSDPAIIHHLHHHLVHEKLDDILRPQELGQSPTHHHHHHRRTINDQQRHRHAQDESNCPGTPFLWKIIDDDTGKHVGFGLGTMHLPKDVVTTPEAYASIESAIEDSCNVFGELNPLNGNVTAELAECQSSHDSATVNDIPSEELRAKIKVKLVEIIIAHIESDPDAAEILATRLFDLPLSEIQRIVLYANTPEYVELYAESLYSGIGVGSLDTSVLLLGRPADDLEEVSTQCDLIHQIFPTAQVLTENFDQLSASIENSLNASLSNEIQLYKCGDIDAFVEAASSDALELDDMTDGSILVNRNKQMAAKMNEILQANPNEKMMFAVGNSHWLIGGSNLKVLLKEGYGYTLEHVPDWGKNGAEDHTNDHCGVIYHPELGFVEDPNNVPGAAPTTYDGTSIPTHTVVKDTYYTTPPALNSTLELVDSPTRKPTKQSTIVWTNSPFADVSGEAAALETPSSGAMIGASTLVLGGGFLYLSWCF